MEMYYILEGLKFEVVGNNMSGIVLSQHKDLCSVEFSENGVPYDIYTVFTSTIINNLRCGVYKEIK